LDGETDINSRLSFNQVGSLTTFRDDDGQLQINANESNALSKATGSEHESFQDLVISWLYQALPEQIKQADDLIEGSLALLQGIGPKNEIEAMLAAQMIATHFCSMEMTGRTQSVEQTQDMLSCNSNMAIKFMKTFCTQLETLNKLRNGGKQTIQVQHVNVQDGGQAVVGNIKTGGE